MILKGRQRKDGAGLAAHLMNSFDNESIEIDEIFGVVADDLLGAFAEFEAVSQGTRCKQYLYSLSISPPEHFSREQFAHSIQTIEAGLGLTGQPRAVVYHTKGDREHCHVVWSRIDVEKMQAIPMSFDHSKLMNMACQLANKYELDLPRGLKAWEKKARDERAALRLEKREATQADHAQTRRSGVTRDERRALFTELYEQADNGAAFRAALAEQGYLLAMGDRRAFVAVDSEGDIHSVTRYIQGHKAKHIKKKLSDVHPEALLPAEAAKAEQRVNAHVTPHQETQDNAALNQLREHMANDLKDKQAARRSRLTAKEQVLLTRQADERLQLHTAQMKEQGGVLFRAQQAIVNLIQRMPALHSVLNPVQQRLNLDPEQRQQLLRDALKQRHKRERQDIAREKRLLEQVEKREQASFKAWLKRQTQLLAQNTNALSQEFAEVADNKARYRHSDGSTESGELVREFNQQAAVPKRQKGTGDRKSARSSWESRRRKSDKQKQQGRGRGYGYKRNNNHDSDPDHGS